MYSNEFVCKTIQYINNNIYENITINDISNLLFINRYYLMRLFKKELNMTIFDYILKTKIYNSLNFFEDNNNSISKIAIISGFNSLEYFSLIFSKIIGVSPSKYRKFLIYKYFLTDQEIKNITQNIINLNNLQEKIKCYLNKNKPKAKSKKLSIFK